MLHCKCLLVYYLLTLEKAKDYKIGFTGEHLKKTQEKDEKSCLNNSNDLKSSISVLPCRG